MNRTLFTAATSLVLVTASAAAQQQATITGRVSSDAGVALPAATVFIESLGIGTQTGNDGRYSLIIPAARVNGQRGTMPLHNAAAMPVPETTVSSSTDGARAPRSRMARNRGRSSGAATR